MRAGLMAGILAAGSGGGGGGADWAAIFDLGPSPLTASNAAESIVTTGTINLSFSSTGTGTITWTVYKNGASQGDVASLAVTAGDSVYFAFTLTGVTDANRSGTMTITGAESDTFSVDLMIDSGA